LVGITFLRCPTPPVYQGIWSTYGINVGGISGLPAVSPDGVSVQYGSQCSVCPGGGFPTGCTAVYRGPRSELLPPSTFVVGDAYSWILSPGHWLLNNDSDNDGQWDSCGAITYNQADPRHNRGLNFVFIDGHVEYVSFRDFLNNKNNMWGP